MELITLETKPSLWPISQLTIPGISVGYSGGTTTYGGLVVDALCPPVKLGLAVVGPS